MTTYDEMGAKNNRKFKLLTCPKCKSRKTKSYWITSDVIGDIWVDVKCAKCGFSIYYSGA